MAQLTVRLDDQIREAFDELARTRGLSASDLTRALIDDALGRGGERPSVGPTPGAMTATQRRLLLLQHEVLARLAEQDDYVGEQDADYHRRMVKVLDGGFVEEYGTMFVSMEPELSRRESDLVHDILAMFHILQFSLGELDEQERATLGEDAERALTFSGFDFNDALESRLHSYAKYLIEDGRYPSMAVHFDDRHEGGNSHSRVLPAYERMLSVWRPLRDRKFARPTGGPGGYVYGMVDLQAICAARAFPRS